MRTSAIRPILGSCCLILLTAGCGSGDAPPEPPTIDAAATAPSSTDLPPAWFEDVTARTGVTFVHDPTITGDFTYPEPIGAGAALFDCDGDGDLDLYLVQGGRIPGLDAGVVGANRLYRNDGDWRFVDISEESGAGDTWYGMGSFVVDIEGDGDLDLYVTNVGPNVLLRNDGHGRFEDVTAASGLGDGGYGLGAAFFDADGDGDLDLYLANYVVWAPGVDPVCWSRGSARDYCGPSNYTGAEDRFYVNRGDGTFEDATARAGIAGVARRGMGLAVADFDDDGRLDVYVANDGDPNTLWINRGDGTFEDRAVILGCAVNAGGAPEASMGVACRDVDDDGDPDLLITHLAGETHTFYRNDGGFFTDATSVAGLGRWSTPDTGFGLVLEDLDRDGDDDLVVTNGAVMRPTTPLDADRPYVERDRIALADNGRWSALPADACPAISGPLEMGRGLAVGDLDGDGRIDLVLTPNRGPVRLLRGRPPPDGDRGAWIGLRLRQDGPNPDAIGARVRVAMVGRTETRFITRLGAYLCSGDPVVRLGLGETGGPLEIEVRWPDGMVERFETTDVGRVHDLVRRSRTAAP
ncbi:MAG: CRTAC1 family protein [Phycisphaerales bacterium]|nr:CRTAC1 family protein [Phycisphaerales bacterium]